MNLGNLPKHRNEAKEGKRYWRLSIGRNAVPSRYFEGGWRAFDFVVFKPYQTPTDEGVMLPHTIKISFAYWLPFYKL